jgi:hypothetical protein
LRLWHDEVCSRWCQDRQRRFSDCLQEIANRCNHQLEEPGPHAAGVAQIGGEDLVELSHVTVVHDHIEFFVQDADVVAGEDRRAGIRLERCMERRVAELDGGRRSIDIRLLLAGTCANIGA